MDSARSLRWDRESQGVSVVDCECRVPCHVHWPMDRDLLLQPNKIAWRWSVEHGLEQCADGESRWREAQVTHGVLALCDHVERETQLVQLDDKSL